MNGPTASSGRRLPAVPASVAGRTAAAGAVVAAAVAAALALSSTGPDASSPQVDSGVRSAVLLAPAQPPAAGLPPAGLPLQGGASSAATAAGRNPFIGPSPPPVEEPALPEEPAGPVAPAGPPPGGRNPFEALVVPEPVAQVGSPSGGPDLPAVVPADPGVAVLRLGSSGDGVRALQQRLRDRGWRIDVDGTFGPRTDAVVRAFQARRGLAADGLVGPLTRSALS